MKVTYEVNGTKYWVRMPNKSFNTFEKIIASANESSDNIITIVKVEENIFNEKEN